MEKGSHERWRELGEKEPKTPHRPADGKEAEMGEKVMNVDALLEEIDRIARKHNPGGYGLPRHAAPTQAMREAVSRFVKGVKKEMLTYLRERKDPAEDDRELWRKQMLGDWNVAEKVADAALPSAPQGGNSMKLEALSGFYLAHKSGSGRSVAYLQRFDSHELAQAKLDRMGKEVTPPTDFNETMHVVEVSSVQREAERAPETTLFGGWEMTEAQIRYMVERFLGWRLPDNFNPDAGISFKRDFNEHTAHPMKHEPVGTNLFDAVQTEAMVRYLVDGMPQSVHGIRRERKKARKQRGAH